MTDNHGFPVLGPPDEGAVRQMHTCLVDGRTRGGALMADHHLGYSMPVGGVLAYHNAVSPSGVGYDIGCGNMAVQLDIPADDVRKNIAPIMDDIYSTLSFGMGRRNKEVPKTPRALKLWENPSWWEVPILKHLRPIAENQLGTIGSGNHYVDVFVDEGYQVWVGVHFGSRGLGHKTATYFLEKGGVHSDDFHAFPTVFDLDSDLGAQYWAAMEVCGEYAMAGRSWVCHKVAKDLLKANVHYTVHNHHNFAWKEVSPQGEVVVVRKGATPNFPGQRSFVGGSMGHSSYILEGQYVEGESESMFYSTVHGAGRIMGRRQAAGKVKYARLSRLYDGGDLIELRKGHVTM